MSDLWVWPVSIKFKVFVVNKSTYKFFNWESLRAIVQLLVLSDKAKLYSGISEISWSICQLRLAPTAEGEAMPLYDILGFKFILKLNLLVKWSIRLVLFV